MKLNCWIIDDEPPALALLESYVKKTPFLSLTGKYSNAVSAMNAIEQEKVDVIFLDIQMPEVSGMEFARFVPNRTRIIFTTSFSEYALEGYKVNALDYLLKPFSFSDFFAAAQKALRWFEMVENSEQKKQENEPAAGIFVKSEYQLIHLLYDDILCVEGLKDYVKIYTQNSSKPTLSLMSLKTLENELPPRLFVRVHRSYIVHLQKIERVNKNRIQISGREIPIGETYRQQFFSMLEK